MVYLIVVLAALARFIPHPPDFSPVYAALLFGGACLRKRDSIWFPVAVLAVGDVLLNLTIYHTSFAAAQTLDWAGFAAVALIGWELRKRISPVTVVAGSLAGATVFFVISNIAVWLGGGMYPVTTGGLTACFVAALPFFGDTLLSAILFSGVLFGAYEFYRRKAESRKLIHAAASTR